MPAITKTIGTASRDYSTMVLWEADLDDDTPYDAGDDAVGEGYNDSAFAESPIINGGGTLGLASITLRAANGEEHDGTAGTGFRIVGGQFATGINIDDSINKVFEDLEVDVNGGGTAAGSINLDSGGTGTTVFARRMIAHDASTNTHARGIEVENNIGTKHVHNCIVYDITSSHATRAAGGCSGNASEVNRTAEFHNCTAHNITESGNGDAFGFLFNSDQTENEIINCIATDSSVSGSGTAKDYATDGDINTTQSHNLASDTTATGTGSLDSKAATDQFVSTTGGSEDLHLKSGADAIDAGTDLATTPTGVNIDIDGRDRDAEGDTWDMGADEFITAAPAGGVARLIFLTGDV